MRGGSAMTIFGPGSVVSVTGGGIDSGSTFSGGKEYILRGGTAIADTIVLGLQVVESGGIASGTIVSGGTQIVSAGGISLDTLVFRHGTELVSSGGTAVDLAVLGSGLVGGRAILSGLTSVGSGAILETLPGGSAIVGGTLSNSGTLYADGRNSLVNILNGATVTGGGIAEVGNGVVDLQATGDDENVIFHAGGTGGLEIGALGSAYTGSVSGFAQNAHQFIDFTAIRFAGATFSYSATSSSSGVLTVTNGGISASINLSGNYTSASFHIIAGTGGTVEFVKVQPAINPPEIPRSPLIPIFAFEPGKFALFGHFLAAGFAGDGAGDAMVREAQQTEHQTLLTHPTQA
jgi:antigen 43